MKTDSNASEDVLTSARDYVDEWRVRLGIEPNSELVQTVVASVDALIQRKGSVSREEADRAAHAAMLNWVEMTISGSSTSLYEEVNW